ncbi:hypothetical protein [Absidia glauca]|uniref:Uncharacterized protein n=1 Tax=Absidia glauca TaxID=4829 RepID=A0A168T1M5_ABSGL|nr:hypothetical protein [Absidia glauca]
MEAIDDYANEHLARSLAYTVLELRQQHHFMALIPMASQALKQRIQYLQPKSQTDADEWNAIIQWQTDACPEQIEHLWQHSPKPTTTTTTTLHDDVYQNPVFYKRFDADTLHVVIPFNQQDDQIYLVILVLEQGDDEEGGGEAQEEPELKYQNTKQVSLEEWQDIQSTWSDSLEEAERLFLATTDQKEAPDDYWGEWSSDEDAAAGTAKSPGNLKDNDDDDDEQEDSEDDYYARWSENPGTLTPGIDDDASSKKPREEQQEWEEEYDQSYNPLFTVPSVPNLVDAHTSALQELTTMLQTSLPTRSNAITSTSIVDPLPKAVQHPLVWEDEQQQQQEQHVPGAYPPSRGTKTPTKQPQQQPQQQQQQQPVQSATSEDQKYHAGKLLLEKSMRALIGAAKLLGLAPDDIRGMVKDILQESEPQK